MTPGTIRLYTLYTHVPESIMATFMAQKEDDNGVVSGFDDEDELFGTKYCGLATPEPSVILTPYGMVSRGKMDFDDDDDDD
jgi:hypothetical protein